ncbi:hypothetical protein CBR_g5753 [Chara braunii]|uniref:Thioredoxin domain-containing protein n=1 Tax=Chara braunii TaxID=69332 RepID=A0A388KJH4_CHABU|nr:hypothetical protein CBR_g5753 [Chara braunii]|eukprot:GBG70123.1 hypothetical protein CBR_g5753 [Chara braunii]
MEETRKPKTLADYRKYNLSTKRPVVHPDLDPNAYCSLRPRLAVEDPTLQGLMEMLNKAQERLKRLRLIPPLPYGSIKKCGAEGLIRPSDLKDQAEPEDSRNIEEVCGPLKWKVSLARNPKKFNPDLYKRMPVKRAHLELVKMTDLDELVASMATTQQLLVVCCLAGWVYHSKEHERVLEKLNWEIWGSEDARPNGENRAQMQQLPLFRLVKVDLTEGPLLAKRYNLKMVPTYFMFFKGKLVYASSAFWGGGRSREDFMKQDETLKRGCYDIFEEGQDAYAALEEWYLFLETEEEHNTDASINSREHVNNGNQRVQVNGANMGIESLGARGNNDKNGNINNNSNHGAEIVGASNTAIVAHGPGASVEFVDSCTLDCNNKCQQR